MGWDVFKKLDLQKIYDAMQKPAFIFDGRDVIDHETARKIGFEVWAVGKSTLTRAPISRRGARCCLLFIASLRGAFMRPVVAQKIDSPQSSGPRAGLSSLYRICVVLFLLAALFV